MKNGNANIQALFLCEVLETKGYRGGAHYERNDYKMTEWEKAQAGYLYDANYDADIVEERTRCADLCYEFNNCRPSDVERQKELLHQILGGIKGNLVITAPFY